MKIRKNDMNEKGDKRNVIMGAQVLIVASSNCPQQFDIFEFHRTNAKNRMLRCINFIDMETKEKNLEQDIESWLLSEGGYVKGMIS